MSTNKEKEEFRLETRTWLQTNCPEGAKGPGQTAWGSSKIVLERDVALWLERMSERGWTVPTWPKEYGGADLENDLYPILIQELMAIGARTPLTGRGVNYIGPTILELGTDEQKEKWLPGISRGEGGWAMGYSEPGAGSDLASLSTRAEKAGDEYLINGRKTWTSDAMDCDYIFVLARTSDDKPKHQGISLVLVDMDQPGVEVHPIRLLSGASPFNETVFNNALADSADVIGGVDNGWSAGKRLLQFERSTHAGINTSGSQGGRNTRDDTKEIVLKYSPIESGRLADSATRARLLEFQMKKAAQSLTQKRTIEETRARAPGFTSSAVKLSNALIEQERDEMIVQVMGSLGIGWSGEPFSDQEIDATRTWLKQKSLTIAGGTKEVQLNIIAKRVLGLPD
ncbi:MAG: acyl-CoA dehydrogenase [Gammaproteobacteria bacterium]|nr:acyl-CoA dehydrogenase [Gammaproteobacteria bacterium]